MDLLAKLSDPAAWEVKPGVPVFKAHVKLVGGVPREVTDADLDDWCRESLALERQTGVCGLLRLGHIRPGEPETNQPPTAGVLRNPRVVDTPHGRRLVVDEWRSRRYAGELPEYPWRSVEMYRDRKRITAVAALKRDPQLHDLGPPNLFAADPGLELYSLGGDMTDGPTPTPPPDAAGTPPADPAAVVGQLVPLLEQLLAALKGVGGGSPADGPPPGPPPEPMGKAGKPPELYALQTEIDRQKAENARLAAAVKGMQTGLAAEKAKAILKDLAAEHYSFDATAELALMTATDDAGRAARAAAIRTHHAKLPPDGLIELFQGPAEPGSANAAAAAEEARVLREATRLMVATPGMTYPEAERQVRAKK